MGNFVGRTSEIERLGAALADALAGQGRVLLVTGEAGAGKSALVEHFLMQAALEHADAQVIGAVCSEQYGAGEPYQPFVETFRELLQESAAAPRALSLREVARELAPWWLSAIPVAGDIIAATMETAFELKRSMGGVATAEAPASQEALFFQYTQLLLTAAATHPVVLFLDDLHWADPASVSLLVHLARRIEKQPVLILGTYRPVDVDVAAHPLRQARLELKRYGLLQELELTPLRPEDLVAYVTEELGAPPTPELVGWLEEHAGATPLFFRELLRWLVDNEFARLRRGEWVLARVPDDIEVPSSAASTIERRLGRLDPDVYRILEYASIQGMEFESTTLAKLLDMDELELEEALEPLVRIHRLIRLTGTRDMPDGDIASVYEFAHSLLIEVLRQQLQGKRRILLHRKIADILRGVYGADAAPIAHRLAVHYDEGRVAGPAFEFAMLAARQAGRVFAHATAIALLNRGLRNASGDVERRDALERLGEYHWRAGHYAEAVAALEEGVRAAEAAGDGGRSIDLRRLQLSVEYDHGSRRVDEVRKLLADLEQEAVELGDSKRRCELLLQYQWLPGASAADNLARTETALSLAQELNEPALLANAYLAMGRARVFGYGSDPAAALEPLGEARRIYDELGERHRVGGCLNALAVTYALLGDYASAQREFAAAAAVFARTGEPRTTAAARNNLGALLLRTGDWEGAEQNLNDALRLYDRIEAAEGLSALQNLAELEQSRGRWDAAAAHWSELARRAQEQGNAAAEGIARGGLGLTHLEAGDLPAARAEEAAARDLLESAAKHWSEAHEAWHLLAARLAAAEGRSGEAVALLEKAQAALASRDPFLWASFRLLQAEIVLAHRSEYLDDDDAVSPADMAREALERFRALGARHMIERTEALLSRIA